MGSSNRNHAPRHCRFEKCEERCMLTTMADVVFLVDESGTEQDTASQDWIATVLGELDASMTANSISVRYGVVGFGEVDDNGTPADFDDDIDRYAHSQLIGGSLYSTSHTAVATVLASSLQEFGPGRTEDGWDSVEQAVAEYDIREGAVPVFILVQGDQGRTYLNDTLTHDGIRRALESKNAILNSVVAGTLLYDGVPPSGFVSEPLGLDQQGNPLNPSPGLSWAPIFDLTAYETTSGDFTDIYVLGVESDAADGVHDRQHDFVSFNTVTHTTPATLPTTTSDALQVSFNGSGTGETGLVGSGKSVVISEALAGGIGGVPSDANDYRAKHAPFDVVDMSGSVEVTPGGSVAYSFDFFGSSYSQVFVNQDGTIELGSSSLSFNPNNVDLSTLAPGATDDRPSTPTIAVLWDDLAAASSGNLQGKILQKTVDLDGDGTSDLAIQWTDYRYAEDGGDHDPLSFQAVLYGDGTIRFNYEDIGGFADDSSERIDDNSEGINATVGIWSGAADPITLAEGKFVPGLHTVFGEEFVASTGAPGGAGEMPDNYARMAWDTGGAAWDVGLVQRFGATSPEANALRDALVDSLVNQINRADVAGQVFEPGTPILELNIGGPQLGDYEAHDQAEPLYAWPSEVVTAPGGTAIDDTSNSIPSNANNDIFKTGRTVSPHDVLQIQSESGVSTGASGFVSSGSSVLISREATAGFSESSVYSAEQLATAVFEDISVSPTATQVTTLDSGNLRDGYFRLDDMEFGDFEFLFYGEDHDALFVSTHGLITFDFGDTNSSNTDWTVTPPAQPSIAVLWDVAAPHDVSNNPVGEIYWERIGRGTDDDRLIIQWENAVYADDAAPYDGITYQAVLYSDGRIQFNYQDLDSVGSAQTGGVSATAGVASPIDDLRFSFDTTTVPGGEYIVELFFSEVDANVTFEGQRVFDVVIEGETVLNDYDIMADHAKIDDAFSLIEHDSIAAGKNTGVVKRFFVNVSGDDGLQIDLLSETPGRAPLLNGLRVIDAGDPRIVDVVLSGSNSAHNSYSFADAFSQGIHEFSTIPVGGADTIEVVFSEWVDVEDEDIYLWGKDSGTFYHSPFSASWDVVDFAFDDVTFTAQWRFDDPSDGNTDPNPFFADRLLLALNLATKPIADSAGNVLDGDWAYPMGLSYTSPTSFPSGDGDANVMSNMFVFTFVNLPGDYNGDNIVDTADYTVRRDNLGVTDADDMFWGDGDGDGDVDSDDHLIWVANFGLDFTEWT